MQMLRLLIVLILIPEEENPISTSMFLTTNVFEPRRRFHNLLPFPPPYIRQDRVNVLEHIIGMSSENPN
jgi:hypothetical protein